MKKPSHRVRRKRSTMSKLSQDLNKPLVTMQFSTMLKKLKANNIKKLNIKTEEDQEEYEKKNRRKYKFSSNTA